MIKNVGIPRSWGELIETNARFTNPDPGKNGINLISYGIEDSHDDIENYAITMRRQSLRERYSDKFKGQLMSFDWVEGAAPFLLSFSFEEDGLEGSVVPGLVPVIELSDLIAENMSPSRINVFEIKGHGNGMKIAQKTTEEIGDAIDRARALSGQILDLLILNGCRMSFLPGLSSLACTAKVILASPTITRDNIMPFNLEQERAPVVAIDSSEIYQLFRAYQGIQQYYSWTQYFNPEKTKDFDNALRASAIDDSIDLGTLLEKFKEYKSFFMRTGTKQRIKEFEKALRRAIIGNYIPQGYQGTAGITVPLNLTTPDFW